MGEGAFEVRLFELGQTAPVFTLPQFTQNPKPAGEMSKGNRPKPRSNEPGAAKHPAGYQRCWCRGFNVGCLIRAPSHVECTQEKRQKR